MPSEINVYGRNKASRVWLEKNYGDADAAFRRVHPPYRTRLQAYEGPRIVRHGIVDIKAEKGQAFSGRSAILNYYWTIYCHWNRSDHFDQTEHDIRKVLKELGSPDGIEIEHSRL